jgi:hypothetical protein
MKQEHVDQILETLIEELAAIEHRRWSHWQAFMHAQGNRQPDGSLVLTPDLVKKWDRQIATDYADLNEVEKESDREQVRQYLPLIEAAFAGPSEC